MVTNINLWNLSKCTLRVKLDIVNKRRETKSMALCPCMKICLLLTKWMLLMFINVNVGNRLQTGLGCLLYS